MIIQHNMASVFANGKLNISEKRREDSTEKLSSGYRINRSADDAAGLTISEKMRWQIRGLNKASQNIADGMSLLQVADGALNESHAVLQRMNELAVQAANDTNTDVDRDAIQLEMDELSEELTRIAETTSFNSEIYPLLGGNGTSGYKFPSELVETTVIFNNNSGMDVEWNGVTYADGEKIEVKNFLSRCQGYPVVYEVQYVKQDGTYVFGMEVHRPMADVDIESRSQASGATKVMLYTPSLKDVKIDENGYLYISYNEAFHVQENPDRLYLTYSGHWLEPMVDENGYYIYTPSAEQCEARCVFRAELQQTSNEIKIQSSALANQSIDIPLVNATAANLGVEYLDVMTHTYASKAITTINDAIAKVSEYRSMFGALQNRLEHAQANVDNTMQNTQDAESKLRDTDMAEEMVNNSAASIISQAAQSMLAQSNEITQGVLQLLK